MNNKKNEPHESASKGTRENTRITGGIPEKGDNNTALDKMMMEHIRGEIIERLSQVETFNFNTHKSNIEKYLLAYKENRFARKGLTWGVDFIRKVHDAAEAYFDTERAKLSKRYICIDTLENLPHAEAELISDIVWTKESAQAFCLNLVVSLRRQTLEIKRENTRFINEVLEDKRLSESDKYYYRYVEELDNSIFEIKMKIIDEELTKALLGAL